MIFQVDKILQDVRVALDENKTSQQLEGFADNETLSLNEIIHSKITEAVEKVHTIAPSHLLDAGYNFADAIYWMDLCSGYVILPDDFLRLVCFEMDDWDVACYNAISADDPLYEKQRSRFKGVRGTSQKPVVAIVVRPEGKALEFYSSKSEEANVRKAMYLPYPVIDEDDGVFISQRCYKAVVYTIASLVCFAMTEAEKGKMYGELAEASLN